jgi:nitroreductase
MVMGKPVLYGQNGIQPFNIKLWHQRLKTLCYTFIRWQLCKPTGAEMMGSSFSAQDVGVLDRIIEARRSVRSFKGEIPSDSTIKAIIHAGVCAPYAAIALGDTMDFRRFIVFRKGSRVLSLMNQMIKEAAKLNLDHLEKEMQSKPTLRDKTTRYIQMLSNVSQIGFPKITEIPCFIIVAERKGMPSVEKQSLAHVMQNMWLEATALGLGFQLVSVIESLVETQEFARITNLPIGEFAFNGCFIGYAAQESVPRKAIVEDRVTTWL